MSGRQRVDTATWMSRMVKHGIADRLDYRQVRIPYGPGRSIGVVVLRKRRPPRHDHLLRDLGAVLAGAVGLRSLR